MDRWRAALLLLLKLSLAGCSTTVGAEKPTRPCVQQNPEGDVPCADFGATLGTTEALFVLGRVITEQPGFDPAVTTPAHDLEQTEVPNETVELRLLDDSGEQLVTREVRTDGDGWVATTLDLSSAALQPGNFTLELWGGSYFLATTTARLLPSKYDGRVVVSDVDLTYLDTDFQTASAILDLLDESAAERTPLPGMPETYRALRRGADGKDDVPLVFLSGSPLFFRRVLAERARLDRIDDDGLLLKPIKLLLVHELLEGIDGGDLLGAVLGDANLVLGSVGDQIGFKLTQLLAQQYRLPATTHLLLLGDDSETDAVVYALFHRTLAGELATEALLEQLDELDVDDYWREAIERLAPGAVKRRDPPHSLVDAIFINQTDVPNEQFVASDWAVQDLTFMHEGAGPLRRALEEGGWIAP